MTTPFYLLPYWTFGYVWTTICMYATIPSHLGGVHIPHPCLCSTTTHSPCVFCCSSPFPHPFYYYTHTFLFCASSPCYTTYHWDPPPPHPLAVPTTLCSVLTFPIPFPFSFLFVILLPVVSTQVLHLLFNSVGFVTHPAHTTFCFAFFFKFLTLWTYTFAPRTLLLFHAYLPTISGVLY